jgi:ribosomal protein S18 acetylase RimI-like enzyme
MINIREFSVNDKEALSFYKKNGFKEFKRNERVFLEKRLKQDG